MSALRQFKSCSVRYGDRMVQGIEVVCRCGVNAQKPRKFIKGHADTETIQRRLETKAFESDGWKIGDRPQADRCPACVRAIEAEKAKPKPKLTVVPKEAKMAGTAEAPRTATREEKRIILTKLDETYDTNRQCYSRDWTDQRVATDLGVPRAWVSELRDQLYGPEGNAEITAAIQEAHQLRASIIEIGSKIEQAKATWGTLQAEAQKLATRAEMVETRLARIEKAVRP